MASTKFGTHDIALPYACRPLCEDAIILADELRGTMSDADFLTFFTGFQAGFTQMCQEIMEKGAVSPGFDPFQLATLPEELLNDDDNLKGLFSIYEKSGPFIKSFIDATREQGDVHIAALLVYYVQITYLLEKKAIESKNLDYKTLMMTLSSTIYNLHKLVVFHSTIPAQAEVYVTKSKRRKGARIGGEAKSARSKELKELVLAEAEALHRDTDATKAASAIYEKLNAQGNWLLDDRGKPILKDAVVRFTAWIRDARSRKLH